MILARSRARAGIPNNVVPTRRHRGGKSLTTLTYLLNEAGVLGLGIPIGWAPITSGPLASVERRARLQLRASARCTYRGVEAERADNIG